MKQHRPPQPKKAHTLYKPKARTVSLRSAAWQRLRAEVLAASPLCRMCNARGRVVPATDVDHIDNDGDNNEADNLQPLCHECHSLKTAADMGKRVSFGCDMNGMPLDPNHPWSVGKITGNRQPNDRTLTHSHAAANREFSE